jgi:hypothetical protein
MRRHARGHTEGNSEEGQGEGGGHVEQDAGALGPRSSHYRAAHYLFAIPYPLPRIARAYRQPLVC